MSQEYPKLSFNIENNGPLNKTEKKIDKYKNYLENLLDKSSGVSYIITDVFIASFILIILTVTIIFIFYIGKNYEDKSDIRSLKNCNPGFCALDTISGEKRFPLTDNNVLTPQFTEICVKCDECKDPNPYAEHIDGSALTSLCETNGCRCLKKRTCPEYVNSIFETKNGSIWEFTQNTNTNIVQKNYFEYTNSNPLTSKNKPKLINLSPPLQIENYNIKNYCEIPIAFARNNLSISPNTFNKLTPSIQPNEDFSSVKGICTRGVFAPILKSDRTTLPRDLVYSCVEGKESQLDEPCDEGEIRAYNVNKKQILCTKMEI